MKISISLFGHFCAALGALTVAMPARAAGTLQRVWVSGHGVDAAGCSAPSNPCRTLQYVHDNVVKPGGEIDVLDPAGYGAINITMALSIVNDGVGVAGLQTATSGQNAITVNAGATDAVYLRGLTIDGLGLGANGILLNAVGSLTVVNCVARHFVGNGVFLNPSLSTPINFLISNTIAADNAQAGVAFSPQSRFPDIKGELDRVSAVNNAVGVRLTSSDFGGKATINISNSVIDNNSQYGVYAKNNVAFGSPTLNASIDLSNINNTRGVGIFADSGTEAVFIGRSVISSNTTGIQNLTSPNTLFTYGDNRFNGNTNDYSGTLPSTAVVPR